MNDRISETIAVGLTLAVGMAFGWVIKPEIPQPVRLEKITVSEDCSVKIEQAHREDNIKQKIEKLDPKASSSVVEELSKSIADTSIRYSIDPQILLAIAFTESHLDPSVRGQAGEYGVFQVMPTWAKELPFVHSQDSLGDIETNTEAGSFIYSTYLKQFHGNKRLALLAYNRGPGSVLNDMKIGIDPDNGYPEKVLASYNQIRRY